MKCLTSLLILICTSAYAEKIPVYVGTGNSKGIYHTTLDTESGKLSQPTLAGSIHNPSALTISPNGKYLFSTGKIPNVDGKLLVDIVHSFAIQSDFSLEALSAQSSEGRGPCHVSIHPNGSSLFVANYSGGSVASYNVSPEGKLSRAVSTIKHDGSSIHPKRQSKAYAHSIYPSPDGKFVYAADLGTDEVIQYSLNQQTSEMKHVAAFKVPPGSGPRHMVFNNDGSILFVLNELTLTITQFKRNLDDGSLTILTTKPVTKSAIDGFSCSEIRLSNDQRFLYAANRDLKGTGRDSICVLDAKTLDIIQEHPAGVWIPRHFNISPSSKWLIVAGQKSNQIVVHKRNLQSGKLSETGITAPVERPMWILFPTAR